MPGFYCRSCGCVWNAVPSIHGGYIIAPHSRWNPEGAAEHAANRKRTEALLWNDDHPAPVNYQIMDYRYGWDLGHTPCEGGKVDIDNDRAP